MFKQALKIILIQKLFIIIILNKCESFIFGLTALFIAFLITLILYPRIKRLEDFALIYLLNKALTKDFNLSKSLLFTKYIAL